MAKTVAQSLFLVAVALAGSGVALNRTAAAQLHPPPSLAGAGITAALPPSLSYRTSRTSIVRAAATQTPTLVLATLIGFAPTLTPVPTTPTPGTTTLTPTPGTTTLTPTPAPATLITPTPVIPISPAPETTATGLTPGPILPGSLSGSPAQSRPVSPRGPALNSMPPGGGPANGGSQPAAPRAGTPPPAPTPSGPAPGRFHLHRPGTEIEGDLLIGNTVSDVYVFRGNVVLHSDPKIDRSFSAATESDEPLTVTADELDVDRAALTYVAKGHVHFVQGDRSGRADTAMLNEQTHSLDLVGNADVNEGDRRARAAKLHYDLADRQFHGAGDVRIYQPLPTPNPQTSGTPAPKRRRRLPIPV